jgi:FlaA1/EpsC-like NDP-sugar epimerase
MANDDQMETQETRTSGKLTLLEGLLLRHRLASHIVAHAMLFTLALLVAYLIRFDIVDDRIDAQGWSRESFLLLLPFFVAIKLLIFWRLKLFRSGWQYASIRDVASILFACWLFLLVAVVSALLFRYVPEFIEREALPLFQRHSQGVLLLDFFATVFLVCTARLGFRIYREELRPVSTKGIQRVLIVGAGNAAENVIREILRMRVERYRVVGLIDDDPIKRGLLIHGVPVLGRCEDIRRICEENDIQEIIIAIPSATQKELRRVIDLCSGTKLKFQSLPGVSDLIEGRMTVSQIRPVDINDLLGREAVELDTEAVAALIRGKRVLITGAGGSIGSDMCRQIANFTPAALILVEQAENPLFEIENELRGKAPQIPIDAVVCDIYDRERVMAVWNKARPDVVVHAAAHKHVPLMERNPYEAIKNNIMGTRNVADASCEHDVAEFVMISTDKAVNPSSIMGASKRAAEIYTQALNGRTGCRTQFKAVRFGNVLGSSGSVVPTFRRQIARGGPVTVTHPEMTRYFMTIPEASQLVLQAAATGCGGQIFLLDMGEPVRIMDLARNMIILSGFRPGEDIDIKITGIRPGEKLFEELRTKGEDIGPTVHPKVLIWKHQPVSWDRVQRAFQQFEDLRRESDWKSVVTCLRELVPEFEPQNTPASFRRKAPSREVGRS